jgi:hypothetical protein
MADYYIERRTTIPRMRFRPVEPLTCRLCKSRNVVWTHRDGAWRLYENGKPHECPSTPDGFDET